MKQDQIFSTICGTIVIAAILSIIILTVFYSNGQFQTDFLIK